MKTALPKDDLELNKAFETILSNESLSEYILEIATLVYNNELNRDTLQTVLDKYNISSLKEIKNELLDLLIAYINLVLDDHIITKNENHNVKLLKAYFNIKEGDFYNFRYQELDNILNRLFELLYHDNQITKEEAIYSVELQEMFGLSYDQFDKFKEQEVKKALDAGADISQLDTAKFPKR